MAQEQQWHVGHLAAAHARREVAVLLERRPARRARAHPPGPHRVRAEGEGPSWRRRRQAAEAEKAGRGATLIILLLKDERSLSVRQRGALIVCTRWTLDS